jgi:N-formylglutamate deformylase
MELACRSYMREPPGPVNEADWPSPYDEQTAARMRATLEKILNACIEFAKT